MTVSPPSIPTHSSRPLLFATLLLLLSGPAPGAQGGDPEGVVVPAQRPLVVTGDVRIRPGETIRVSRPWDELTGVILVRGLHGVTIDLTDVSLRGSVLGSLLDRNEGLGLVVVGCQDVTIRGGSLGGYKGCLVVERSSDIVIEDVTFDGWYGQRLLSTAAAESPADWLRPHDNDAGEWLDQYGAAISVTDCKRVTIRRCRGRHGQNGILLTRSTECEVYDNDFSFLSGWGLAMYRASGNVVSHNIFDYCVRGYSHDVYWRGQDSAGILLFERCSDNVFAYNSATHCGDGVFLFAGQDLVEGRARSRGELGVGGSDDNLWYKNDLRFAVANGLKATFSSRNDVIGNWLSGCHQHGIWAGYSNNMLIVGNEIDGTVGGGITIEHGQDCLIAENSLRDNSVGLELYWDEDEQLVGGPFGKYHDTSSSGHWIVGNTFADNDTDVNLFRSTRLTFLDNHFSGLNRSLVLSDLHAADDENMPEREVLEWLQGSDGSRPSGHLHRTTIASPAGRKHGRFEDLKAFEEPVVPGSQVTPLHERGEQGGLETIVIGEWGPWDFRSGEPRPAVRNPGGVLAGARWDASWFHWDRETEDPRGDLDAWRALRYEPVIRKTVGNWFNPWVDDDVRAAVGNDRFGVIATTRARVSKSASYWLTVVSDDGVRFSIDGEVVLEDWTWHAPKTKMVAVELERGIHTFDLEYFQIGGASALSVDLVELRE